MGDAEIVNALLRKGAEPARVSKVGDTPLHEAARAGSIECCSLLLAASADELDVQSKKGDTPLILGACWGHAAVCDLLRAAGADETLATRNGWTADRWAAKFERRRRLASSSGGKTAELPQDGE